MLHTLVRVWGIIAYEGLSLFMAFCAGTSNWSGDYFISTGGISCTVRSTEPTAITALQEQLKGVFERDWLSHYAHSYEDMVKE